MRVQSAFQPVCRKTGQEYAYPFPTKGVESIIHNQGKMVPCSVYLEGEYGESDICCGVPVILGKNGIEKIVELPLNEEEKAKFAASAAAVRKTNAALHEVGAL